MTAIPATPDPLWQDRWWAKAQTRATIAWRGVEAQHIVATMRLVDTLAEQDLLEHLLESSKPPLPPGVEQQHYLLATPFRYPSPHPSRFRPAHAPGVWYGAEDLRTAGTEVAYWRWRFLMDSEGLRGSQLVSEHTFFQARINGACIDLTTRPWLASATHWQHPNDYGACHAFAQAARERGLQWVRYASARRPEGRCAAVFDCAALTTHEPHVQQTWVCRVDATRAWLVHGQERGETVFVSAATMPA